MLLVTMKTPSPIKKNSASVPSWRSEESLATSLAQTSTDFHTTVGRRPTRISSVTVASAKDTSAPIAQSRKSHCASTLTKVVELTPGYPSSFTMPPLLSTDIIWCVSLAHCILVPIYPVETDCPSTPLAYWIHMSPFISQRRPHHLIIVFPSCTLRVCSISEVFLTRFTFRTPPMIRPPTDRHHLIRQY